MRIIKVKMCYNCPYRTSFIYKGDAVWVCNHHDRDELQIGDAMAEPPEWCPLEYVKDEGGNKQCI